MNTKMKTTIKITFVITALGMMVPEASAIFGVRRRTAFRTAVVVGSTTHAADMAAMSHPTVVSPAPASTPPPAAAPAVAPAAASVDTPPPTTTPALDAKPLPIGTVVSALPPGCVSTPVGGVEYYYGGGNFYRAVFQGNSLVYVTAQPK